MPENLTAICEGKVCLEGCRLEMKMKTKVVSDDVMLQLSSAGTYHLRQYDRLLLMFSGWTLPVWAGTRCAQTQV